MSGFRRLLKEIQIFRDSDESEGVDIQYNESDLSLIYITIDGPIGTPYYGGKFRYEFNLDRYPFRIPHKKILNEIFHVAGNEYEHLLYGCCDFPIPKNLHLNEKKWVPTN